MVSFQCDGCGDVVKKPKLPSHRCRSTFSCIDCSVTFQGRAWETHTSCITEAQKFQKHIYQNKTQGNGQNNQKSNKKADKNQNDNSANDKKEDKPVSLIDQLKKRKNEDEAKESESKKQKTEEKKKDKKKKDNSMDWNSIELDKDVSTNLKLALKHVLKDGPISLRDAKKKAINLIEKHPKYKKDKDLKKAFDKVVKITLVDDTVTFL